MTTPKRCELPLFFTGLGRAVRPWKALYQGSLNMQFQQDWPKDQQITASESFCTKTNFLLDKRTSCGSRGIDKLSSAQLHEPYAVESSRLAEPKYTFLSRTGRKNKKLCHSKVYRSTILEHGLLEGSTRLFQCSYTSHQRWKALD